MTINFIIFQADFLNMLNGESSKTLDYPYIYHRTIELNLEQTIAASSFQFVLLSQGSNNTIHGKTVATGTLRNACIQQICT